MTLPRYNWDQAELLGLATARGFKAFDIPATRIRKWASRNKITAVGKAPGGAHLYPIQAVAEYAERHAKA
jgi:hypothetical protein